MPQTIATHALYFKILQDSKQAISGGRAAPAPRLRSAGYDKMPKIAWR